MPALQIVFASVAAAILYGIVHAEITSWLSAEYFALGHTRWAMSPSPGLSGLAGGAVLGLCVGVLVALAARVGRRAQLELRDVRVPLAVFYVALFVLAIMALAMGWAGAVGEKFHPPAEIQTELTRERWRHYVAAEWAHSASYAFGAFGGLAVCAHTLLVRRRRARGIGVSPTP